MASKLAPGRVQPAARLDTQSFLRTAGPFSAASGITPAAKRHQSLQNESVRHAASSFCTVLAATYRQRTTRLCQFSSDPPRRRWPERAHMAILLQFEDHPERGVAWHGSSTTIPTSITTQPARASAGIAGPAQTPANPNQVTPIFRPEGPGRFSLGVFPWDGTGRGS